jgi:hypothetical protein
MKKKVVFILSAGHSGSSLLSLILGSHPRCFSAGEFKGLPNRYRKQVFIDCVNKNSIFWETTFGQEGLHQLALGLAGVRIHSYLPLKLEKTFRNLINKEDPVTSPYSFMFSKMDVDVIVDSSKAAVWFEKRLESPEFTKDILEPFVIHLVRDGRAVTNSFLRKYPHWDIEEFSRHWMKKHQERQTFLRNFSDERKLEVRYEKLASNPLETTKEICAFLGLNFEQGMLQYWRHDHHDISGNEGAYSFIDKYKGVKTNRSMEQQKRDFYDNADLAIKLDLRWKRELPIEYVEKFNTIAGSLNKPYEWND